VRHLGIADCPKATTLSYANAHRPWALYRAIFDQTLPAAKLRPLARPAQVPLQAQAPEPRLQHGGTVRRELRLARYKKTKGA